MTLHFLQAIRLAMLIVLTVTTLSATGERVEIGNDLHKVVFERDAPESPYVISTYIIMDGNWVPFFDGRRPLVQGSMFDLSPTSFRYIEDTEDRTAVAFSGARPEYRWDMTVESARDNPFIAFRLVCHLEQPLPLPDPQPDVLFWMNHTTPAVVVDQGPMSIYGPANHGAAFPAAYLWNAGKEAVVFFDMTPMTWMSASTVQRFLDMRVKTVQEDRRTGIGLNTFHVRGGSVPPQDMKFVFYLYAAARKDRPTKLMALDRMVQVCAPLHAAMAPFPETFLPPFETSWRAYADTGIGQLMTPGVTSFQLPASWADPPLSLVDPVVNYQTHGGDFSTNNNLLSPWILFERLNPDPDRHAYAMSMKDALPLYYYPEAKLMHHGVGGGETAMSWQELWFHVETIRTHDVLAREDYNPAIAGRFLMAAEGLIELAHRVDYVFPQWFNAVTKEPMIQQDVPSLGVIREPWQGGTYAYIMMRAFELTGDSTYRNEARACMDALLRTMTFEVTNEVYSVAYGEAGEFPITELQGNAFGAVAACKLYKLESDPKYLDYARDFLNTLLRLTPWHEDDCTEVGRSLRSLGTFKPHGGAYNATPWEQATANLCMAHVLKHYPALPVEKLLLKLSNLNRVNGFHYFPPAWNDVVRDHNTADAIHSVINYMPIEPFYSLEAPGGHTTAPAIYKPLGLWNYWMYEALADADNRDMLVLNMSVLDDFEESISSTERHLVVFNPTDAEARFRLRLNALAEGDYWVRTTDPSGTTSTVTHPMAALAKGIFLTLGPLGHLRVTVTHMNAKAMRDSIRQWKTAQARMAHAYQLLQVRGRDSGINSQTDKLRSVFMEALRQYREDEYNASTRTADKIVNTLSGQHTREKTETGINQPGLPVDP